MPRRTTRRGRRERKERRDEAREAGLPVREVEQPAAAPPDREAGFSYTGALGGLLGAALFFTLAAVIVVDPGVNSRLWAVPLAAAGVFFVPAVIASLIPGYPRRERVLRVATIGSMLIALAGSFIVGLLLAVLLAPATALLAIGAGLVFQGSGAKK